MRTDQLECLITINKTNSINAASEKLYLTPQAVSISIKNLEKELGVPLLIRSAKHTLLTEQGKIVVDAASDFLKRITSLHEIETKPLPTLKGNIQVLATPGISDSFFPSLICDFLESAPDLKINISTTNQQQILQQIYEKENLIGMLFYDPQLPTYAEDPHTDYLEFFPLLPCKFVARIPTSNPLASYSIVSISSLLQYPIIILDPEGETAPIVKFLYRFGQPTKLIFEENLSVGFEMISRGIGISFGLQIPFKPAKSYTSPNIRIVPLKENLELSLNYVLKKNMVYPELTFLFLEQVYQYLDKHSYPFPSFTL